MAAGSGSLESLVTFGEDSGLGGERNIKKKEELSSPPASEKL